MVIPLFCLIFDQLLWANEGVRSTAGKFCTDPSNTDGSRACVEDGRVTVVTSIGRDQKRPKSAVWVTPGPKMEVAPTYLRVWDWVWVAVGGMADAPLPLAVPGEGDAAPRNLRTRAIKVLLDSKTLAR